MGIILMLLAGICYLVGFVASIMILIEAFKSEIWKGIVGLLCGLYLLYFAIAEMDHPNKWVLIALSLIAPMVGYGLLFAGGASMLPAAPPSPAGL